jgi:hypothetical protein
VLKENEKVLCEYCFNDVITGSIDYRVTVGSMLMIICAPGKLNQDIIIWFILTMHYKYMLLGHTGHW